VNISHLKKQAKNLAQILPIFLAEHKDISELSACQELAARINGFPSWHSAIKKSGNRPSDTPAAKADNFQNNDQDLLDINRSLPQQPATEEEDLEQLVTNLCLEEKSLETKFAVARDKLTAQIHASFKAGEQYHHLHELRSKIYRPDYYTNQHDILNVVRVAGYIETYLHVEKTTTNEEYIFIGLRQKENPDQLLNIRYYGGFMEGMKKRLMKYLPLSLEGVLDSEINTIAVNSNSQQDCEQFIRVNRLCVAGQDDIKKRPTWLPSKERMLRELKGTPEITLALPH
jgi:hypothetical protein